MKHNQKGFGAVEVIIVIIILGLVGGVGWYVFSKNKDSSEPSSSTQVEEQSEEAEQNAEPEAKVIDNERFTLTLPNGFEESAERIFTYTAKPGKTYSYANATTGDYFELNFEIAASGISSDYTWFFTEQNNKITLEKASTTVCSSANDEMCTSAGNNRLDSYIGSKTQEDYYFTFGNTKTESPADVTFVDEFIENLTIK